MAFIDVPLWQQLKARDFIGGLADGSIVTACHTQRYTLTAAQIIGMSVTPVTVAPIPQPTLISPNANLVMLPKSAFIEFIYPSSGGVQFTGGGAISLVYHGTSVSPFQTLPAADFTAAASGYFVLPPAGAAFAATLDVGLDITNATAPFAAGNGTAIVMVEYTLFLTP
jgi:hypothetical protein